jgi:BlaI family penicillinase repressor
MKGAPKISETEWEIMRVIWARHPITAADVVEELTRNDASWHPKTARTLLARLVKKGALEYEPLGRVYVYKPKVSERECQASASRSFLDRVFGGSLKPMLAHFAEEKKLTREDLRELSELLEKKGGKK